MARLGRYIVLRDINTSLRRGRQLPPDLGGVLRGFTEVPPEPCLECSEITPGEAKRLVQDPEVLSVARAMPTRLIKPEDTGEALLDPFDGDASWGVSAVGAVESPYTGAGVKVAVLDTGIDAGHPAFSGAKLVQRDFTGGEPEGAPDDNGHGTHCAG